MKTTLQTRSSLQSFQGPEALRKRSSPPRKSGPGEVSVGSRDAVSLSGNASAPKRPSSLWATAVLGGMAALSLAGCVTSSPMGPPISQAPVPQMEVSAESWESAPVELLRAPNGEVVINLGIDNQVVNPDNGNHYRLPGADNASWTQRGETVCKQALDIGGECEGENIATVTTPHGTLIIEQNDSNSIDVYSQDGGHTGVRVQAEGIELQTFRGETYFANDGSVIPR